MFESLGIIADDATDGRLVRLTPLRVQRVALADLSTALADLASGTPLNAIVMIAGPGQLDLSAAVQCVLTARHDLRRVVPDSHTFYRGSELSPGDTSLLPELQIATSHFGRLVVERQ
ncbi:MAG: hypothetical protein KKA97_10590 [Actinobacteria bacterium]|nr:hypothetical protein [Actinomycetota bacterium]